MSLLLDRSRRSGGHLEWRIRLFSIAAVLGLAGIYFEEGWMTGVAVVVLFGGLGLRFLPGAGGEDSDGEGGSERL